MASAGVDIEVVKAVLRDATGPDGPFSQRGLSGAAQLNRDAVYDIINGRNRNPTIATLASIAEAMGTDLSVFGIVSYLVTEEMLREAFEEHLPLVPKKAGPPEQARYLAAAVARSLQLPHAVPANDQEPLSPPGRRGESTARALPKD